ncbi:Nif3-like dinuclear metal center hexameric protein [Alkaliphilus peptidifermentans]|uniref:GTP cyclohydrolase 1 type 2 homolog n=1 Tax=Alkaliphilus peptidifermentans DSM 18978 TaxID=1120976 RepID=A0A1G5BNA9_9FIRM|nr:Nif3-like dinuclear metal center hexameric protein [Alkaliphilus peptidifermentans]SCX91725.1 dinuclear metal center protein, YbgI/SA1388 family [Alkaliphilus peptidifermentans DSM 18978]
MAEKIKLKKLTDILEALAPTNNALSWDNVGLQVGDNNSWVSKILVCLDVNEKILDEAIEKGCQVIVSHHPLIFKPMKSILNNDIRGKIIIKAIKNNISIYASHTNMDIANGGLNDFIAQKLGLKKLRLLDVTKNKSFSKLVVFVPEEYSDIIADVMGNAGAGHIGNYSHCSFKTQGVGTFKPLEGTNPFIGHKDELENVNEIRLETIIENEKLNYIVEEMIKAHPYEEVAYDIYPLHKEIPQNGIGRIADVDPILTSVLIEDIKASLEIENIRFIGDVNKNVSSIAIVNGSGAEYIQAAVKAGCDCLITGDVKYHEAQIALELGLNVMDVGHYESEIHFIELITEYLQKTFHEMKINAEVVGSKVFSNPFQYM